MPWFLLVLLGSCPVGLRAQQPDTIAAHVQVLGADCALFPTAARLPGWHGPAPAGRFTPSVAQAQAAEQALAGVALRRLAPQPLSAQDASYARRIQQRLPQYHRQYFGYYNQQGQPCLYLNCLAEVAWEPAEHPDLVAAGVVKPPPPGHVPHWLRAAQQYADAGDNYWGISYNLATRQLFRYWHDLTVGG